MKNMKWMRSGFLIAVFTLATLGSVLSGCSKSEEATDASASPAAPVSGMASPGANAPGTGAAAPGTNNAIPGPNGRVNNYGGQVARPE